MLIGFYFFILQHRNKWTHWTNRKVLYNYFGKIILSLWSQEYVDICSEAKISWIHLFRTISFRLAEGQDHYLPQFVTDLTHHESATNGGRFCTLRGILFLFIFLYGYLCRWIWGINVRISLTDIEACNNANINIASPLMQ